MSTASNTLRDNIVSFQKSVDIAFGLEKYYSFTMSNSPGLFSEDFSRSFKLSAAECRNTTEVRVQSVGTMVSGGEGAFDLLRHHTFCWTLPS